MGALRESKANAGQENSSLGEVAADSTANRYSYCSEKCQHT